MLTVVMLPGTRGALGVGAGCMSSTPSHSGPDAPQMPVSAPACAGGQGRGRQGVFYPRVKDFEENHAGKGAYLSPVQKTWALDLSPTLTVVWPHVSQTILGLEGAF